MLYSVWKFVSKEPTWQPCRTLPSVSSLTLAEPAGELAHVLRPLVVDVVLVSARARGLLDRALGVPVLAEAGSAGVAGAAGGGPGMSREN